MGFVLSCIKRRKSGKNKKQEKSEKSAWGPLKNSSATAEDIIGWKHPTTEKGTVEATLATQSQRVSKAEKLRESRDTCLMKRWRNKPMRISDNEIKKIQSGDHAIVGEIAVIGEDIAKREAEAPLVKMIAREVINMPDREDMVAELKARIDAGEYNPTGDDIADAMIRRNIADPVR